MQASKELWDLVLLLKSTDKESFQGGVSEWHSKWEDFLNERKIDEKGRKRYVHKKLRSAYRSLITNMPWLFTWYDYPELKIPKTTNAIDGHFADLKNKLIPNKNIIYTNFDNWFFYVIFGLYYISYYGACENFGY